MLFKEIHESKERCECSCEVYEEEFLWFIAVHNKNLEIWFDIRLFNEILKSIYFKWNLKFFKIGYLKLE